MSPQAPVPVRAGAVVTVLTVLVVAVSPLTGLAAADGTADGVTGPPSSSSVPATDGWSTAGLQEQDDPESCVIASSGAYPENFQVSCPVEGGNATVRIEMSGGWGYVVYMNSSSPAGVRDLDLSSRSATTDRLEPGRLRLLGVVAADTEPTRAIAEAWRSRIQVDADEVAFAGQSSIEPITAGRDPVQFRYFSTRQFSTSVFPEPGSYRLRLVAYEPSPPMTYGSVGGGSTTGALREQTARALDSASTKTATVTIDVSCEAEIRQERTRDRLYDQLQNARARAQQAARLFRGEGYSDAVIGDAAAAGDANDAMSAGVPGTDDGGPGEALEASRDREAEFGAAFDVIGTVQQAYANADAVPGGEGDQALQTNISDEAATEAVADALAEQGISPPPGSGLSIEDYVRTEVDLASVGETATGERKVTLRIGPNGNLLPTFDSLPEFGPCQQRQLQSASQWLTLEYSTLPGDDYDVQAQLVDVPTSEITAAEYVGWNEQNSDLDELTADALDRIGGYEGASDGIVSSEADTAERVQGVADAADQPEATGSADREADADSGGEGP